MVNTSLVCIFTNVHCVQQYKSLQVYVVYIFTLFVGFHYLHLYIIHSRTTFPVLKCPHMYNVPSRTLFTVVHCLHLYIVYICILFTVIHCLQHSVGQTLNTVDLFFCLLLVLPMWHSTTVILCVFYLIAIRITILNGYKCMQLFVQIKKIIHRYVVKHQLH